MARLAFLAGTAWMVFTASVAGQNHPDFAGKWTLVRDPAATDAAAAFGETFVATQYSTSLIIDWAFVAQGRSGKEERRAHAAFIFDGTGSNVTDIYSGSSHSQSVDTSAWDGPRLAISTTWRGNTPPHVTMKRTIWLDADGALIVETSKPPAGGGAWSTTRSRYRRVAAFRLDEARLCMAAQPANGADARLIWNAWAAGMR